MTLYGVPQGVTHPPKPAPGPEQPTDARAPGTLVLAFAFLAAFVLYYFVNWKLLAGLWKIG